MGLAERDRLLFRNQDPNSPRDTIDFEPRDEIMRDSSFSASLRLRFSFVVINITFACTAVLSSPRNLKTDVSLSVLGKLVRSKSIPYTNLGIGACGLRVERLATDSEDSRNTTRARSGWRSENIFSDKIEQH
ncbi:hypothetical protein BDV23DRAFT_161420 [Aspergillus alliaceus]|uniref:Uncharacterized protein n=1 Tax=Petromyces alliaceus TaxID=209559 RepID=A0A5N7BZV1_PETAA|nr:hypothetical protein BDV23DRAFT_161420 [Aspergillus alliaceus]